MPNKNQTKKPVKCSPFPVTIDEEIKQSYREEAFRLDRSMHWLMQQAIKTYVKTFGK
jgi:predicted transcriptional regulator